ncbi:MAG TPA: alkaline phosphatase family protein [Armatimonadota bacterium]|jgi:DNA-binding beta-propeller fold protein YncE
MKACYALFALVLTGPLSAAPLPTGASITPSGVHTPVGCFPANLALSPNGRYVVVTDIGSRSQLSVLNAATGALVSQIGFNRSHEGGGKDALYVGLAFTSDGLLYVSRGTEDKVTVYTLDDAGTLSETVSLADPGPAKGVTACPAGLALSSDAGTLFAANNYTTAHTGFKGTLAVLDTASKAVRGTVATQGYPFAVAAVTKGKLADTKVFVACERDGVVADVDPKALSVRRSIATGDHPAALLLDASQRRLFVANAGSDTISVIDPAADRVTSTTLLRPAAAHALAGATPTGMALDAAGKRLYVALGDMNAVAVVDVAGKPRLLGYVPTGWYPTAALVAPDGGYLFVANAKGVDTRHPNATPSGPNGAWGRYTLSILEGAVSRIRIPTTQELKVLTAQVLKNNRLAAPMTAGSPLKGIPVKHVIYIIKENRTYDEVMGDATKGNGDPSLVLFGQDVTPNQHALANRFALLDNFYVCAEVSADGWNWSTSGMTSEYTARNVPFNYGGRGRTYDFEGENSGVPVDLLGLPDVARSPGGYIWENAARHGVGFRNYGFFNGSGVTLPDGRTVNYGNGVTKRALLGKTDVDYLQFNMEYADSDAWVKLNAPETVVMKSFGKNKSPSRYTEWKREWDAYVKNGKLPPFTMIRLPRNHTAGTTPGMASPRAMVADNDYALGEIVEAVSKSRYWKSTAIFVLEDDAQNGFDHVDSHRSPSFVISPLVRKGTVDHRFYNTDSVLRTMELLLGLPPMNRFDATAPVLDFWNAAPDNSAPYTAILPDPSILRQVTRKTAYRAAASARMNFRDADDIPEQELNDILWHSIKGTKALKPAIVGASKIDG